MTGYYQRCPVCNGTGLVTIPPGIAGDAEGWTASTSGPYECHACGGKGIIPMPQAKEETFVVKQAIFPK